MSEGKTINVYMSSHKWNILLKLLEWAMKFTAIRHGDILMDEVIDLYEDIYLQVHGVEVKAIRGK